MITLFTIVLCVMLVVMLVDGGTTGAPLCFSTINTTAGQQYS